MRVAIAGYSTTRFSLNDVPIENVLTDAMRMIFENAPNLEQKDIDTVLVSTNENRKYLGAVLAEMGGISPKIAHNVESLCNSGTNALVSAFSYITSGLADVALVVGAERFDSPGQVLDWDITRGEYNHPIFWASMFAKAHKRKYGTTDEQIAKVSAINHANAKSNPNAYVSKNYTLEEIMNSKKITEDLRLLDCSRPCTGGAGVLLVSENIAKKITDLPVWVSGIGHRTISASFAKNDLTTLESTKDAANQALVMAEVSTEQIDVLEVHDAFSICEIMILEDIGIVEKGDGGKYTSELYSTASKKVNPRGGLIGSGHPLGATGLAQVAEIAQQLQQKAGKRQVEGAKIGLVHNMSAAATSSTVLVLSS
ncbi:thiolase family protein [Candidatus Nitrosotenuis uzonensis]|uniref:Thiolase, C-terminal domain protein n=1 Tax=Candidatus Nitrosotenuis uzonensis TaxID=1407055 RepID=V6ASI3_9ARCH|nr:thiolase family protein [Candidatus Nitrosotenuis uzonensis]CDI05602.1 putative thiolase, C-terminal domain protein [Candidatus Nitrosotenuis uzonensis]